jgi:hypothetical protein
MAVKLPRTNSATVEAGAVGASFATTPDSVGNEFQNQLEILGGGTFAAFATRIVMGGVRFVRRVIHKIDAGDTDIPGPVSAKFEHGVAIALGAAQAVVQDYVRYGVPDSLMELTYMAVTAGAAGAQAAVVSNGMRPTHPA